MAVDTIKQGFQILNEETKVPLPLVDRPIKATIKRGDTIFYTYSNEDWNNAGLPPGDLPLVVKNDPTIFEGDFFQIKTSQIESESLTEGYYNIFAEYYQTDEDFDDIAGQTGDRYRVVCEQKVGEIKVC